MGWLMTSIGVVGGVILVTVGGPILVMRLWEAPQVLLVGVLAAAVLYPLLKTLSGRR